VRFLFKVFLFCFFLFLSKTNFLFADVIYYSDYGFGKFSSTSTVKYPTSESFVIGKKRKSVSVEDVKIDERKLLAKKVEDFLAKKAEEEVKKFDKSKSEENKSEEKQRGFAKEYKLEVYFNFDSFALKQTEKEKIDKFLTENAEVVKNMEAYVYGSTDCVGSSKYNLRLSQKRADVVASYLKSRGIKVVESVGRGEKTTEDVLCLNRVVEVIFE